jgi:hypothetical protein
MMRILLKYFKLINFYPPFLGAGIYVHQYSKDFKYIEVNMKLRWYNKNVFGTHFGGSLYAMCDPFYVFMIMYNLGKNYIVWDKAANIKFLKPGTGLVKTIFEIDQNTISDIKKIVDENKKGDFTFNTTIQSKEGETIAIVEKVIYVRKKN